MLALISLKKKVGHLAVGLDWSGHLVADSRSAAPTITKGQQSAVSAVLLVLIFDYYYFYYYYNYYY